MVGRAPYRGLLTHGFTVDSQGRKMSKSLGNGVDPQETCEEARRRNHPPVGRRQRLLGRHRRRRQDPGAGGRHLPAHPQHAQVPARQHQRLRSGQARRAAGDMLEIDRYALSRAAQLQADILAHYEVYEFHPVVAKLQIYCSEDLGAFYLDILKDRLYTTAAGLAGAALGPDRPVADHPGHAALDGAIPELHRRGSLERVVRGRQDSRRNDGYRSLPASSPNCLPVTPRCWTSGRASVRCASSRTRRSRPCARTTRWARRCRPRSGSKCPRIRHGELLAALQSLGDDLRFVFITSKASVLPGAELRATPTPVTDAKCERCWHYRDDVGVDAAHPGLCGRCTSNLFGAGETRSFA